MPLQTLEIETGPQPTATVLWLHGLGADGNDFAPIVPELVGRNERALRFVFPHAPVRPITINGGMRMRAWYDILAFERQAAEDAPGIRATDAAVGELLRRENERGIASERIVLAGFSQGGAIALFSGLRYPQKLAGIMALSCYLLLESGLTAERAPANQGTPIFLAHGNQDPLLEVRRGLQARQWLQANGYAVQWHAYDMPHSVCPQEVADIADWLRRIV
ncbi:MAG TPA: alpha/beta hydrolase-fold protein [Steroidobacteraceae bacterium]